MLTDEKREKLKALLLSLGPNELRMVAQAVEAGRHVPGLDLPADEILEAIRPRLGEVQPRHVPTLSRVICEPSDDLFSNIGLEEAIPPGCVSRATVAPFVQESAALLGEVGASLEARMITAYQKQDWEGLAALKSETWQEGEKVWTKKLTEGVDDAFRERVGGANGVDSLRVAIQALRAAEKLVHLRGLLPEKPARALEERECDQLVQALEAQSTVSPNSVSVLLCTVFRRFEAPDSIQTVLDRMEVSTVQWSDTTKTAISDIEALLNPEEEEGE